LYLSLNIITLIKSKSMSLAGHVAYTGQMRDACKILVTRPKRKRPLERPRRRWEENIKMNLK